MRQIEDPELTTRIHAFLDKKRAQFPELGTPIETKSLASGGPEKSFTSVTEALLKPFHVGS